MDELMSDLLEMQRELDALPPAPWCIRTTHSVPYGRCFRQWDTRGRLILWANRGELADLPHRKREPLTAPLLAVDPGFFGIPVYND